MSTARSIKYPMILAIIALVSAIIFIVGCTSTAVKPTGEVKTAGKGQIPVNDVIVAKVGDAEINLGTVMYSLSMMAYLKQGVIMNAIYEQEAKKRGVYPTPEKIEEAFKKSIDSQGGEDKLMQSIPPTLADLPRPLILAEFRNQSTGRLVQTAILEDEFKKVHGENYTQEELDSTWNQASQSIKTQMATDKGITPEEVTMDMALPKIQELIRQKWMGENGQKFFDDLTKAYPVTNFLMDQYLAANPPKTEVEVPKSVEQDELGNPMPGAIPSPKPGGGN
jgi:hypothetical protein